MSISAAAAFAAASALGVSGAGTITTIAGTGKAGYSGDGGPATSAQLRDEHGIAVDSRGNVYIATYQDGRVRRVSPNGTITTFAGTDRRGYSGDGGPATSAMLRGPEALAVDGQGNVYIADHQDYRVRKVSPGGTITTFAGTGVPGFSGDGGPATSARLYATNGVAVDAQGSLYISDSYNQRVRKVSPGGTITTIAGTGTQGFSGDGGRATSAQLRYPRGVALDRQGNVYVLDNNRVRKVSPGGTITTIAGGGSSSGDGIRATSAQLRSPSGLAVDRQGNVYIADFPDHRVRKVSPGGTITTIAGTGKGGFSGDGGPATAARLWAPYGVAVDGQGNVYVTDTQNYRVRKVTAGASQLTLTLGGSSSQRLLVQKGIVVTARCNAPCSLSASGSVTILGRKQVFALTRATALLSAGTRTLGLGFPATSQKRFRRLFQPGQRAQAVITVKATGGAGGAATAKRTVAVRR